MSLPILLILLALWTQGTLAFVILFVLGRRRLPLVARGEIKVRDIALDRSPWPETVQKASNAFDNQFQLPLIFAVGCGIAVYLGAGWPEAVLAWAFVISRIVHATIHITANNVYLRFSAYAVGLGILAVMWLVVLGRIVLGFLTL